MSLSPDHDPDVVELSVRFGGFDISVRGSVGAASDFVRGLSTSPPSPEASVQSQSGNGYSTAAGSLSATPVQLPVPVSRSSIRESLPPCPTVWISAGSSRLSGGNLSGAERAIRAWTAGAWAASVLRGEIGSPDRSPAFSLGNRVWVVARCDGLDCPRVYHTSQAFFRAVGRVPGSSTVCHGFASRLEAEIYLAAAGLEYPPSPN